MLFKINKAKSSSQIGAFLTHCLPIELAQKRCWIAWKFSAEIFRQNGQIGRNGQQGQKGQIGQNGQNGQNGENG